MRVLTVGFVVAALFGTVGILAGPANGASLTCVQTAGINEAYWGDALLRHLRDEGFVPPKQPLCWTAMLSGEIEKGDADRLEALIQANLPFLGQLAFNSNGGNLTEAMQIGRVARRYYLATEAPSTVWGQTRWLFGGKITDAPGAICASACFFAWLGGVNRTGDVLGIHRPFPPASEMQRLSPTDAERLYHGLSDNILTYLTQMDAATHWLSDMMRIPSDDIYIIPEQQVRGELEGDARAEFDIPSMAQWKFAKCGGLSIKEWGDLMSLARQALDGTIPKRMVEYHDYLESRLQEVDQCGKRAVIAARWALHVAGGNN